MSGAEKLTEADLDAAIAYRHSEAPTAVQTPALPILPAGCSGDCDQGRRDCTCGRAVIGMWDDERQAPWLLLLYAAAFVGALVASAIWPWGFAS